MTVNKRHGPDTRPSGTYAQNMRCLLPLLALGCASAPCEPLSEVPLTNEVPTARDLIDDALVQFDDWSGGSVCLTELEVLAEQSTQDNGFGEYYANRGLARVFITPDQSEFEIVNTLWHELCHAADDGISDRYAGLLMHANRSAALAPDPYEDFAAICAYGPAVLELVAQDTPCDSTSVLPLAIEIIHAEVYRSFTPKPRACP